MPQAIKNSSSKNGANAPVPVGRQAGSVKTATDKLIPNQNAVKDSDKTLTGDAERTKKILANEPKISYIIPLGFGEKMGAYETVSINGYKLTIQKGTRVEIPLSMAKLLDEYLGIQNNVGLDTRIDLQDTKVQEILA